jgi:hypothetical protein
MRRLKLISLHDGVNSKCSAKKYKQKLNKTNIKRKVIVLVEIYRVSSRFFQLYTFDSISMNLKSFEIKKKSDSFHKIL